MYFFTTIYFLRKRSRLAKRYFHEPSESNETEYRSHANKCSEIIIETKERYFSKLSEKLNDPKRAPKCYWSILNTFLGNKKIPIIPPLLVDNKIISDFVTKADLFNTFFASQCTPLENASTLPSFDYKTDRRLSTIKILEDDIYLIIKNLNPAKAHGWDNISIRMLQLCGKSIVPPLKLIFPQVLKRAYFLMIGKKVM